MDHTITDIPKSEVAKALETLPKVNVPQCELRKIDPNLKETRWAYLRPEEASALRAFLAQLSATKPQRIKVGPLLARAILIGLNWRNPRALTVKRGVGFANEMLLGRWRETTDGFGICIDGQWLLNGQHRLCGIELSGIPQVFVVSLLPEASGVFIDNHKPRTTAVNTGLPVPVCQVVKSIWATGLEQRDAPSNVAVAEIYQAYQDSIDLALFHKINKNAVVKAGTLSWCHGQLTGYPKEQQIVEKFIEQFATGSMLGPADPAYKAREYFRNLQAKKTSQSLTNMTSFHKLCNCVYDAIHGQKVERISHNERAAQWFRDKDLEKVNTLRNKPLDLPLTS